MWCDPQCIQQAWTSRRRSAMFECGESQFSFNRCLRQGGIEAPRLRRKMAMQLLGIAEENCVKKRMSVLLDVEGPKHTHTHTPAMQLHGGRQFLDHVTLQKSTGTDAEGPELRSWIWHRSWQVSGGQVLVNPKTRFTFQLRPRQDATGSLLKNFS